MDFPVGLIYKCTDCGRPVTFHKGSRRRVLPDILRANKPYLDDSLYPVAWDEGEARNMSKVKTYEITTPTYSTYINLSVPVLFEDSLLKASHSHSLRLKESAYDVIFQLLTLQLV